MFLKMYNVKMLVPFSVSDGTQTLLGGPVFLFKAQSVRTRSKWLRQSATLPHPENDTTGYEICQILSLSNSCIFVLRDRL